MTMHKYAPLLLAELYLLCTILLFKIGVWNFKLETPFIFYCLLLIYHLAFILGYFYGINTVIKKIKSSIFDNRSVIITILIINIFMVIINAIRMGNLADSGFNFIERLVVALQNPAWGYKLKANANTSNVFLGSIGTYILSIWGIVSYAVIPLGFYHFDSMTLRTRLLFYANLISIISGALIIGTNKRIFDIVLSLLMFWWLRSKNLSYQSQSRIIKLKYIFLIMFFAFFAVYVISDRGIGTYWNSNIYKLGGIVEVNHDSPLLKFSPSCMHGFWAVLCAYLCQGYFGFSLAPSVIMTPMLCGGVSLYLVDEFQLNEYTYQYAIEQAYGWDSRVQWASIYTWIANDVGLYGVIIVMFFMGYLFAKIYKECIRFPNPIAYVLMFYMLITIIFIPCNFQILQDVVGLLGICFWGCMWGVKHLCAICHN